MDRVFGGNLSLYGSFAENQHSGFAFEVQLGEHKSSNYNKITDTVSYDAMKMMYSVTGNECDLGREQEN